MKHPESIVPDGPNIMLDKESSSFSTIGRKIGDLMHGVKGFVSSIFGRNFSSVNTDSPSRQGSSIGRNVRAGVFSILSVVGPGQAMAYNPQEETGISGPATKVTLPDTVPGTSSERLADKINKYSPIVKPNGSYKLGSFTATSGAVYSLERKLKPDGKTYDVSKLYDDSGKVVDFNAYNGKKQGYGSYTMSSRGEAIIPLNTKDKTTGQYQYTVNYINGYLGVLNGTQARLDKPINLPDAKPLTGTSVVEIDGKKATILSCLDHSQSATPDSFRPGIAYLNGTRFFIQEELVDGTQVDVKPITNSYQTSTGDIVFTNADGMYKLLGNGQAIKIANLSPYGPFAYTNQSTDTSLNGMPNVYEYEQNGQMNIVLDNKNYHLELPSSVIQDPQFYATDIQDLNNELSRNPTLNSSIALPTGKNSHTFSLKNIIPIPAPGVSQTIEIETGNPNLVGVYDPLKHSVTMSKLNSPFATNDEDYVYFKVTNYVTRAGGQYKEVYREKVIMKSFPSVSDLYKIWKTSPDLDFAAKTLKVDPSQTQINLLQSLNLVPDINGHFSYKGLPLKAVSTTGLPITEDGLADFSKVDWSKPNKFSIYLDGGQKIDEKGNIKNVTLEYTFNLEKKDTGGSVDITPPTLEAEWFSNTVFGGDPFSGKFTFSEPISSISEIGFFSPDGIPDLGGSITSYSINGNEVSFTGFLPGTTFQLYIKNAKDMSGNTTPEVKGGTYNPG